MKLIFNKVRPPKQIDFKTRYYDAKKEAEEKSPAPSKKPSPLVGIMIVLGIVVIGLVGYLVMSKPKR